MCENKNLVHSSHLPNLVTKHTLLKLNTQWNICYISMSGWIYQKELYNLQIPIIKVNLLFLYERHL